MPNITGHVTVYESSDGGKPSNGTTWQFFVGGVAVKTENHWLAQTMRLAILTNTKVAVTYDAADKTMSQARIDFANQD